MKKLSAGSLRRRLRETLIGIEDIFCPQPRDIVVPTLSEAKGRNLLLEWGQVFDPAMPS
ncbi:MAG TPA: hypothetical protein VMQ17_19995 [Candidatus Sulfotelmatobacter sp.]|nr:hypothetical protein [Candidatus Sulfotelmatobacter sp.]